MGSGWSFFSPCSFPVSRLLSTEKRSRLPVGLEFTVCSHVIVCPPAEICLELSAVSQAIPLPHLTPSEALHSFHVLQVSDAY